MSREEDRLSTVREEFKKVELAAHEPPTIDTPEEATRILKRALAKTNYRLQIEHKLPIQGGSGFVFIAQCPFADVGYRAIKLVRYPTDIAFFFREAKIQQYLGERIDGVPRVYPPLGTDFPFHILDNQTAFVVMDYIPGCDMEECIESPIDFPLGERIRIGFETLDLVTQMHEIGIAHHDIKPGNIMVTYKERDVFLIDFSGAQPISQAEKEKLGLPYTAISCTVPYADPAFPADPDAWAFDKSDQFSLGNTLYELFTLKNPRRDTYFKEDNKEFGDIDLDEIKKLPFLPDLTPNGMVTPLLCDIVNTLKQPDPEHRYHNLQDALDAFANIGIPRR